MEDFLQQKAAIIDKRHVLVTHPVTPFLWVDFVRMTPLLQDLSPVQLANLPIGRTVTVDLYVTAARLGEGDLS